MFHLWSRNHLFRLTHAVGLNPYAMTDEIRDCCYRNDASSASSIDFYIDGYRRRRQYARLADTSIRRLPLSANLAHRKKQNCIWQLSIRGLIASRRREVSKRYHSADERRRRRKQRLRIFYIVYRL